MKKKLLAILGSPHKNGSTATMLDCAIKAAKRNDWEVVTIHLYEKKIAYCTGCRVCSKTGECIIDDDIREIANHIKTCDRIILAAPTYWANVPAAVKNLFDRLVGTVMQETKTFPRPLLSSTQSYLLLTACNTPFPFSWLCGQSRGSLRAMDEFFKTSGMKHLGSLVYAGPKESTGLPARIVKKIQRHW